MGRVSGAFYDERGAPTAALAAVEVKAAKAAELKAEQEVAYPACNSAWSEAEGEVGVVGWEAGRGQQRLELCGRGKQGGVRADDDFNDGAAAATLSQHPPAPLRTKP